MSRINHRRKNVSKTRIPESELNNGYRRRTCNGKAEKEDLDKSMHGWANHAPLSNRRIAASIGNDFTNGNRGMAKAVRGAKKYVRTRTRFHENAATRKLVEEYSN